MKNLCKILSIKLFTPDHIQYYEQTLAYEVKIQYTCGLIAIADTKISSSCIVRKEDRVELWEEDTIIFKGYIYDYEDIVSDNITNLKINGEKGLTKKMINLRSINYISTPINTVINDILVRLGQSYKLYEYNIQSNPLVTIEPAFRGNIFDVFDDLAKRASIDWDFIDGKFYFGKLYKDTDTELYYTKGCDNDFNLVVSEGDRGSTVFGYDSSIIPPMINSQTLSNPSQGCLGMYSFDYIGQPLQDELDKLQGANYIYKISNILQTINANVCDTVVINIDNCGRYTGRNKVKIQQINITYSGFIKKSEFILSNYEIQFYNWYGILIKK